MTEKIQKILKRAIDIIASSILLLLLLPVFLITAIAVKLDSSGPIFYRWEVVGENGKSFIGYKFRTMYTDRDINKDDLEEYNRMDGPTFKMKDDPRVTDIGEKLRKYSIDELPQLWSVLKGEMSLIGPRPPLQEEYKEFSSWHKKKLEAKPGMACLREVKQLEEGAMITDFDEWVKLDIEYIENWSLWLDFKIMSKTLLYIIRGENV